MPAAIESLSAAIRLDPDFASAYVLLARAHVALAEQRSAVDPKGNFQRTLESAFGLLNKAIALDPKSGERMRARTPQGVFRGVFQTRRRRCRSRRGIELSPNYSRGYEVLASILFQSVARRREALEMIEKARRLDPLAPHLDVLKATYLLWGPGDTKQAVQVLEGVLERIHCTRRRWSGWPMSVGAAKARTRIPSSCSNRRSSSIRATSRRGASLPPSISIWERSTRPNRHSDKLRSIPYIANLRAPISPGMAKAGESAYKMVATNPTQPQSEALISLALRQHAHVTGEYRRASEALEKFASVSWDGDEPELQGQTAMGNGVAGLAELLIVTGHRTRADALLEELLADTQVQVSRYGRGEVWVNPPRAMALAMLGRPDEAVQALQRQVLLNFGKHNWRTLFEFDPALDSLRDRKDFQALLAEVRANADRQRGRLQQMRADGWFRTGGIPGIVLAF